MLDEHRVTSDRSFTIQQGLNADVQVSKLTNKGSAGVALLLVFVVALTAFLHAIQGSSVSAVTSGDYHARHMVPAGLMYHI